MTCLFLIFQNVLDNISMQHLYSSRKHSGRNSQKLRLTFAELVKSLRIPLYLLRYSQLLNYPTVNKSRYMHRKHSENLRYAKENYEELRYR